MAEHGEVEYATATGNDYGEHEGTYERFVKATVVGTIFVINVVIALAIWTVAGHWLVALGIFVIATIAAIQGLASGSGAAGVVTVVIGLLALAATS